MTNRRRFIGMGMAVAGSSLLGCAGTGLDGGWMTLVDGTRVPAWARIGEGNWSIVEGTLQGRNGKAGYHVALLLHVKLDRVVHLRGRVGELAGIRQDEADLDRPLCMRRRREEQRRDKAA